VCTSQIGEWRQGEEESKSNPMTRRDGQKELQHIRNTRRKEECMDVAARELEEEKIVGCVAAL